MTLHNQTAASHLNAKEILLLPLDIWFLLMKSPQVDATV
jgi:hypothetical protein